MGKLGEISTPAFLRFSLGVSVPLWFHLRLYG